MSYPVLEVIDPGPLALMQDRGRFGFSSQGVSPSGAFDRRSASKANSALGNTPDAPVIEALGGGFAVRALAPVTLVVTGTQAPVTAAGTGTFTDTILDLRPGDVLTIGEADWGCRAYVAVRGGFAVSNVLGSASSDCLSGIGPAPLRAGNVLFGTGAFSASPAWFPLLRQLPPTWSRLNVEPLKVVIGPREDWFTVATVERFFREIFRVTPESNRVGVRLESPRPLQIKVRGELPSEGMVRGAIEVPPDGQPVILGPDHPVTGGYPVIGVLDEQSCDRCAQLLPGQLVRFEEKLLDQ